MLLSGHPDLRPRVAGGEARVNIVLTNDDGFDAAGLNALFIAAKQFGDVTIVAPTDCHSVKSHAVTLNQPLTVQRRHHPRFGLAYASTGTPADNVRLALGHLPIGTVDVVLSGINHGANAGADVHYSGTVAAAREAVISGTPAIAISQLIRPTGSDNWARTAELAAHALRELLPQVVRSSPPKLLTVNLPDLADGESIKGIKRCPLTLDPLAMQFEPAPDDATEYQTTNTARYFDRAAPSGFDFHYLLDGWITVTPLLADATDHSNL